jgi:hypothetical protein
MAKITKDQKDEPTIEKTPQAPVSAGGAAAADPKFLWSGNLCECGKPVAPGQDKVCAEHIRSR